MSILNINGVCAFCCTNQNTDAFVSLLAQHLEVRGTWITTNRKVIIYCVESDADLSWSWATNIPVPRLRNRFSIMPTPDPIYILATDPDPFQICIKIWQKETTFLYCVGKSIVVRTVFDSSKAWSNILTLGQGLVVGVLMCIRTSLHSNVSQDTGIDLPIIQSTMHCCIQCWFKFWYVSQVKKTD